MPLFNLIIMARPFIAPALVLFFCLIMTAMSRGMGESYGVFLLPLSFHFNWDRATVASVYSIYMLNLGFGSLIAGIAFDKLGPRFNYIFGTILLTLCYGGASLSSNLWQLYLFLGVFGGIGAAMVGIIPTQSLVSRWFNRRLSTALSIAYSGQGLGTLTMAPTAQFLINWVGWNMAYGYAGAVFLIILFLISILPWRQISEGAKSNPRRADGGHASGGVSLINALKTPLFWGFFMIFFTTAFAIFGVSLQVVAYLVEQGFTEVEAALSFGLVGMLAFAGMALTGIAGDIWPRHIVATISYSLSLLGIAALVLLQFYHNWFILSIFILGFGLSAGARGPIVTTLMAEIFAGRGLASIYGAANLGQGVGAAFGAYSSGLFFDFTGNYNIGFAAYSIFAIIGASLFWLVPEIKLAKRIL